MTIRFINATFESTSIGEFETIDDAFRAATISGVEIAATEVSTSLRSTIVQVAVDLDGKINAAKGAVAIATERFKDSSFAQA